MHVNSPVFLPIRTYSFSDISLVTFHLGPFLSALSRPQLDCRLGALGPLLGEDSSDPRIELRGGGLNLCESKKAYDAKAEVWFRNFRDKNIEKPFLEIGGVWRSEDTKLCESIRMPAECLFLKVLQPAPWWKAHNQLDRLLMQASEQRH
ncbi:hypothetical protein JTE90_019259 [Oedothorax gibbosus]|uniref:Uncharacterized protein n=1 Tax=Oedothorax gibbosus TaxID=931172 RepID=A0AAV6US67_9ARAC|nr:hypothetical protein JTE90_019259 [Oedothorax gibbosus]